MGRKNSFLRTCLLPMAASMEPRYEEGAHQQQHHVLDDDSVIEDCTNDDDYDYEEEQDSDEEFGWKAKPGRKGVFPVNRRSLYRTSTKNMLHALPPQDLVTRMFFCVVGATIASIILLRNESPTSDIANGPAWIHPNFDLFDQTMSTATFDVDHGPRAYAYNAGILQWEQVGEDLEHMAIPNEDESGNIRYYAVALSWDGRPIDPVDPPNYWQPAFMRDGDYRTPQTPTPSPVPRPTILSHNPTPTTVTNPPAIIVPPELSPTPAPVPAHVPVSHPAGRVQQRSPSLAVPTSLRHTAVAHGGNPTISHVPHHAAEIPTFSSYEAIPTSHVYEWDDWDGSSNNYVT